MANNKCPMAGISECSNACKMYDNGQCGLIVGLRKIGEVANALGALKKGIADLSSAAEKAKQKVKA